jgi:cell division septation protein DedD
MKIICPKCQYENQADSSRIVCARCATIIEVKQDQGTGPGAGGDLNGRRQTARLPFVGNVGNSQPLNNPVSNPAANPSRDVYATRVGDDFDDVLDIPRQPQPGFSPANEPASAFEDVFAMPSYDAPANYEFPPQERKPTAPIEGFPTGSGRQRSTQDYGATPEPEFMGWPVLPENSEDDQEQIGGFSANRGALLARVALIVVVFGLLSFLAYYFLFDKIGNRQKGHPDTASSENSASGTTAAPTYPPAKDPSTEPKPPEVKPSVAVSSNPAAPNQAAANTSQPQTQPDSAKQITIPPIGKTGPSQSPKPVPPATVPATPKQGSLTIQVASFSDQAQANDRVSRLQSLGAEARVVKADVSGKTWYRVQVGGYKTRDEALSQANKLKSQGAVQDFIITTVGK